MKCVVILCAVFICFVSVDAQRLGGLGAAKIVTPEVQGYADQLRREIETKAGVGKFNKFIVVAFKTQVVAGTNYFMKIDVGDNAYIHARVHKSLSGSVTLSSVQVTKSRGDPIEYF